MSYPRAIRYISFVTLDQVTTQQLFDYLIISLYKQNCNAPKLSHKIKKSKTATGCLLPKIHPVTRKSFYLKSFGKLNSSLIYSKLISLGFIKEIINHNMVHVTWLLDYLDSMARHKDIKGWQNTIIQITNQYYKITGTVLNLDILNEVIPCKI